MITNINMDTSYFFDFEKKTHMYSREVNWIRFFTYQHWNGKKN